MVQIAEQATGFIVRKVPGEAITSSIITRQFSKHLWNHSKLIGIEDSNCPICQTYRSTLDSLKPLPIPRLKTP